MPASTVLCLGGMDPSGGAGLLADIKTLHQFGVQGFGVATAITYQNDRTFTGLDWIAQKRIENQLLPLMDEDYHIKVVKIGLIESLPVLRHCLNFIFRYLPAVPIVWDPVLRASAGYTFHQNLNSQLLNEILDMVTVFTPNEPEAGLLAQTLGIESLTAFKGSAAFILKGGHQDEAFSEDVLYQRGQEPVAIRYPRLRGKSLHGSGCVFASALAAAMARDQEIAIAFANAKDYVYELLKKSETALGQHHLVHD